MVGVFERGICRGEPLSYESWHEESSVSFFPTTLLVRAFFARSMYYLILWFMLLVLLLLLLVLLLRCYCFDVNDDFGWGLWQQHQQLDSDTARRILWLLSDCGASHQYIHHGKGSSLKSRYISHQHDSSLSRSIMLHYSNSRTIVSTKKPYSYQKSRDFLLFACSRDKFNLTPQNSHCNLKKKPVAFITFLHFSFDALECRLERQQDTTYTHGFHF